MGSVVWPFISYSNRQVHLDKKSETFDQIWWLVGSVPGFYSICALSWCFQPPPPPPSCLTLIYILFSVFPAPVFPISFLPLYWRYHGPSPLPLTDFFKWKFLLNSSKQNLSCLLSTIQQIIKIVCNIVYTNDVQLYIHVSLNDLDCTVKDCQ